MSNFEIKHHHIPNFSFTSGDQYDIDLAYAIQEPSSSKDDSDPVKTVLIPTCFGGRINTTCTFPNALSKYRVLVVAMLGNGESSSPSTSSAPRQQDQKGTFPTKLDYRDQIRAQHALCTALGVEQLAAVIGFSMGGQQAYYWASMYPQFISEHGGVVVICGSAKTSEHNYAFLEGPISALTVSKDYDDGRFREAGVKPVRGLKAFSRAYQGWIFSAEWLVYFSV
jgi:pimeloyl-ACP methyl ester carboxylesterase